LSCRINRSIGSNDLYEYKKRFLLSKIDENYVRQIPILFDAQSKFPSELVLRRDDLLATFAQPQDARAFEKPWCELFDDGLRYQGAKASRHPVRFAIWKRHENAFRRRCYACGYHSYPGPRSRR